MRAHLLSLCLLALCAWQAAGARDGMMMLMGAPMTAPSESVTMMAPTGMTAGMQQASTSTKPKADLTFFLTADNATWKSMSTLKLKGTALSVPYTSKGQHVKVMPTVRFANSSVGSPLLSSDGMWLDTPQALLYGMNADGNFSSIALSLQGVKLYTEARHIKFNVTTIPTNPDSIKLMDGPLNAAVSDSKNGVGPKLDSSYTVNETWTDVTLVIQSTGTTLHQPADTKFLWGLLGGWGPWGGWGGCGWGCGYGGYNGYYNGYNGWYGK